MKKWTVVVVFVTAMAYVIQGRPTGARPQPRPEHQKLAALVGTWTTKGEAIENPFGPAEKWTGTITAEWFAGRFAVVRRVKGMSNVSGEARSMDVITYDATAKTYTWYGIDDRGTTAMGKGSISGDTLTVFWDIQVTGKPYRIRGTLKGLGTDRLTWVAVYSADGESWKEFFHSSDTRSKAN